MDFNFLLQNKDKIFVTLTKYVKIKTQIACKKMLTIYF